MTNQELQDEVARLKEELANRKEHRWQDMLDWRGVEDACKKCSGAGVRVYSSTALWRGGIGGQAITNGICDSCWGSGDSLRPWLDLRRIARAAIQSATGDANG